MSRVRPNMASVSKLASDTGLSIEDAGFLLSRAINARGDAREFDVWTMRPVEAIAEGATVEESASHQPVNRKPGQARPDDYSTPGTSDLALNSPAQVLLVLRAAQQFLAIHEARLLEGATAAELCAYVDILLAANNLATNAITPAAPAEGGAQ